MKDLDKITDEYEKENAYTKLLQALEDAGLIKEHCHVLLESIDNLLDIYKRDAYLNLLKASKQV